MKSYFLLFIEDIYWKIFYKLSCQQIRPSDFKKEIYEPSCFRFITFLFTVVFVTLLI